MSALTASRQDLPTHPDHQAAQVLPDNNPTARSITSLTSIQPENPNERVQSTVVTMNEVPSMNQLITRARAARQAAPKKTDEEMIASRIKHYIDEFVTLNNVLLIIFGLFMVMTQAFAVGYIGGIVAIQVAIGLRMLMLFKNQCTAETQDAKRRNGYKIFESILLVIFLLTIQMFISDSSSSGPVLAVMSIFLVNQVLKSLFLYGAANKSKWRFDRYLNTLVFLFRLCSIVQLILIIARCINPFGPWRVIFIPMYITAGLLLLHTGFFLYMIFSKMGRTLWKPMTIGKFAGLIWMIMTPIIYAAGLVWCAIYIAGVLDDGSSQFTVGERPLLLFFLAVIVVNMVALFYIYCFEAAIILTSKYIACLFEMSTKYRERMLIITKKLQEDYANSLEDKHIPKILQRVSNVYFKTVTKDAKGGRKVSPFSTKEHVKDIENPVAGDQEQKEEVKPVESLADLEKNESTKCVICFDGKQDAVYLPCGHGGVCYGCAEEVMKAKGDCHLCRKPIRRLIKVETEDKEFVKVLSVTRVTKK